MKKLLLLPVLLLAFSACDKPKEPENVTAAKSLVGTYNYTRVGELKKIGPQGQEWIEAMNESGTAIITHSGGESSKFQVIFIGICKDTITANGYVNHGNDLHLSQYTAHYLLGEKHIKFDVDQEKAAFDNLSIFVQESYKGEYDGHGLLSLQRQ